MGLAELFLGKENPFSQYVADNSGKIHGAFAGLGQGTDFSSGMGQAALGAQRGGLLDDVSRQQRAAENKLTEQGNATRTWLEQQGFTDLVPLVDAGQADIAYTEALKRKQPGYGQSAASADWSKLNDGTLFNQRTGETMQVAGGAQPEIPMNSTIQNAILGADEVAASSAASIGSLQRALELNDAAYDGPFAEQRAAGTALFGDSGGQATLELKNIVTANALESLKATFGAAPTEGERKILLEIQGSVDQPKAVREAIFKRAIDAANRRIASNAQKAGALRSGEYFQPTYGQQQPGGQTSTGVQWSIE